MMSITHIHPMLVHFPIVLFIIAVVIDVYILRCKGDLGERNHLTMTGFYALFLGLIFSILAAVFGDIALDAALDRGFSMAPLEEHETLASLTIAIFAFLAAVQSYFLWRRRVLKDGLQWLFVGVGLLGLGVLLSTVYHGGYLVYELGVNVSGVKP